jgi:hypothetical protein
MTGRPGPGTVWWEEGSGEFQTAETGDPVFIGTF